MGMVDYGWSPAPSFFSTTIFFFTRPLSEKSHVPTIQNLFLELRGLDSLFSDPQRYKVCVGWFMLKMTTSPETLWLSMGQKLDQISTGRIHLQRRPLCCLSVMEVLVPWSDKGGHSTKDRLIGWQTMENHGNSVDGHIAAIADLFRHHLWSVSFEGFAPFRLALRSWKWW